MFLRSFAAATSIAALFALSACTATVGATDPGNLQQKQIEPLPTNAIAVDATDTLDILISGGMPSGCPSPKGYATSSTSYHVDFAAKTLHYSYTPACDAPDGAPGSNDKDAVLTAADRDALVADVRALVLETPTDCGEDGADQRVTVKRPDGSSESHFVDLYTCRKGELQIQADEYMKLTAALSALLK